MIKKRKAAAVIALFACAIIAVALLKNGFGERNYYSNSVVIYPAPEIKERIEADMKLENKNLCYICDSDAAIYFTGTSEQCLQYLQEHAEMFTVLPPVMILTEEKYIAMFFCDIDYVS